MSTSTEITRLQTARNTIRDKLIELGMATSTDKLDDLATSIDGIVNRGAISASVQEGASYTIPAGYHNGSGTVSGIAGGGNYELQTKSATPTKSQQTISPDSGKYGLSSVTVNAIPEAYQNVSSVTAGAGDVLATKIIVTSDGTATTGTMLNNGAVSQTLDGTTTSYTVPAGYHNGSGSVSITTETKTATPSTSSQTITPTSGKVLTQVTVNAIPAIYGDATNADAVAANILDDVVAITNVSGVATEITGTMPNNGAVSQTLNGTTTSYTVPAGYHNGSGTVSITTETKTATPTTSSQTITPTSGKVLTQVTVNAIPSIYGNATNADAVAANILDNKVAITKVNGIATEITGTMPNNGAVSATIDGIVTTSYTVPAGYHNGSGTVSLTNAIETALSAI